MLLITQTLLNSYFYTFDCTEGYEDDAMESFLSTLRREKSEPNEAMQNGINFENAVYQLVKGGEIPEGAKWEKGIRAVATRLKGAMTQVKCYRDFNVGGYDFKLFGIMDALKAGHIFDVKFMNKSMGSTDVYGKYLTSAQHPAYLFATPEAIDFTYLLSDGDELYTETYTRADVQPFPEIVSDFISGLRGLGLLSEYEKYWQAS